MIKVIIFDVDGVLVNSEMFSKRISEDYGISIDKILPFFKGVFRECQLGKADLKEELAKVMRDWGWAKSTEDLLECWFKNDITGVDQGLLKDIEKYRKKGIRCYLGTNQEKYRIGYLRDRARLDKMLDGLFVSFDIGFRKPDKEFFEYISNFLVGIKAEEVLFCDSDQEIVDAAKEFGFQAELYISYSDFKNKMEAYLS